MTRLQSKLLASMLVHGYYFSHLHTNNSSSDSNSETNERTGKGACDAVLQSSSFSSPTGRSASGPTAGASVATSPGTARSVDESNHTNNSKNALAEKISPISGNKSILVSPAESLASSLQKKREASSLSEKKRAEEAEESRQRQLKCEELTNSNAAVIILESLKKPGDEEAQAAAKSLPIVACPFYAPHRIRCLNHQYGTTVIAAHKSSVVEMARQLTNGEVVRLASDPFTPQLLRQYLLPSFLPLFASEVPTVSIEDFIEHLLKSFGCGVEGFIMALCLLAKLPPNYVPICDRSIHRMVLTALVLSCKLLSDQRIAIKVFASIGGVSKEDMVAMEWAFLTGLGFDASVTTSMYVDMIFSLRQHCSTLSHHAKQPWAADAWRCVIETLPVPSSTLLKNEIRAATLVELTAAARQRKTLALSAPLSASLDNETQTKKCQPQYNDANDHAQQSEVGIRKDGGNHLTNNDRPLLYNNNNNQNF